MSKHKHRWVITSFYLNSFECKVFQEAQKHQPRVQMRFNNISINNPSLFCHTIASAPAIHLGWQSGCELDHFHLQRDRGSGYKEKHV